MEDIKKEYTNGEVTIVWQPGLCIHSKVCWTNTSGLPDVFNPREKPWIKPLAATTGQMVEQIKKCPSGALSYYMNNSAEDMVDAKAEGIVEVMPNGPLLVYGNLTVKHKDKNETKVSKVTAFCRCGASSNKPYCDGTHTKIGFNDSRL